MTQNTIEDTTEKVACPTSSAPMTEAPTLEATLSAAPTSEAPDAEIPVYFEDLPLSEDVLDALYDMRFETCTPIQAGCIPQILKGTDMIGIAQTGTGKTAAYLLPMLTLLAEEPHESDAVNCLIMAPTRELAQQIDQALQGFAYYTGINGVAVYGGNDGVRFEQERRSFQQGADIVIATPGRLITHLQLGNLDLSRTTHLILDEADRMLDMGFIDDIKTILKELPAERQVILFSATMPDEIASLAKEFMHSPAEVKIAVSKPAEKIDQSIYVCRDGDKTPIVKHLFADSAPERVILFASSKQRVKELNIILRRKGFNCAAMHSDLDQRERDEVMLAFKQRRVDMLIATDIVSRGIDIDDIQMVINYDCPRDPEDYVHRIGRTARAGKEGRAVTLVGEKDLFPLRKIERLLEEKLPRNPLPEGCKEPAPEADRKADRKGTKSGGRGRSAKKSEGNNSRRRGHGRGRGKADSNHSAPSAKTDAHHSAPSAKTEAHNSAPSAKTDAHNSAPSDKPQGGKSLSATETSVASKKRRRRKPHTTKAAPGAAPVSPSTTSTPTA